jgi:hypothetical protein
MYLNNEDVHNNDEFNINIQEHFLWKSRLTIVRVLLAMRRIGILKYEEKTRCQLALQSLPLMCTIWETLLSKDRVQNLL